MTRWMGGFQTRISRLSWTSAASAALALQAAACDRREDIRPDPSIGGSTGTTLLSDGSFDVAVDAVETDRETVDSQPPPVGCPKDLPGPSMVEIPAPGGVTYCIDSTEVTQAQYFDFLTAKGVDLDAPTAGDTSGQREDCEGKNSRFAPYTNDENPTGCSIYPLAFDWSRGHPDYPVGCVDWCDANAYCAWAGKRLCGKIGGESLDVEKLSGEVLNMPSSQFYYACSQGDKTAYSYGDKFESSVCADKALATAASSDSGTAASVNQPAGFPDTCRGDTAPYDQVHDLSGNLGEWQDGCWTVEGAPGTGCGVSNSNSSKYPTEAEALRCDSFAMIGSEQKLTSVGFRCCLD